MMEVALFDDHGREVKYDTYRRQAVVPSADWQKVAFPEVPYAQHRFGNKALVAGAMVYFDNGRTEFYFLSQKQLIFPGLTPVLELPPLA